MKTMETRRKSAMDYEAPSYQEATEVSERRTSQYDSIIKPTGPKFFKARPNNNTIRILPPTWAGAKHYSYEAKVHNDVGAQKQQYICLDQNEMAPERGCPLCAERNQQGITYEDKEKLRAKSRNFIYLIDRFNSSTGPLLWSISTQSDKEILIQSLVKRTQEYLPIAHPIKGYDIDFYRDGDGLATRYRGFMVSRESTPISTNQSEMRRWIDYIDNNPIPETLQFFSPKHIKEVYYGYADSEKPERNEEERVSPRSRPPIDEDRRDSPRQEARGNGEDGPPWDEERGNNEGGGGNGGDRRTALRDRLDHTRR
jgi:hypothetical protein